ncbi:hypothetical protein CDAR_179951, partial [Caerostris darwini]
FRLGHTFHEHLWNLIIKYLEDEANEIISDDLCGSEIIIRININP